MLGIDKDHSQNSASLDGTNVFFTLVKCVLHNPKSNNKAIHTIFQRESTLCFVSLELFIKWKIDLDFEKST